MQGGEVGNRKDLGRERESKKEVPSRFQPQTISFADVKAGVFVYKCDRPFECLFIFGLIPTEGELKPLRFYNSRGDLVAHI